jgi:indolepyruvate ferredoxin oxidoreductase
MSMGGLPALPEPVLPMRRVRHPRDRRGRHRRGDDRRLLGMAAHLENKGVTVLDMAGLAQKGGAVLSHVQIAAAG